MNPTDLATARAGRRFTMMDAMILVGASAAALGLARTIYVPVPRKDGWILAAVLLVSGLLAGTPAALILRLRGPRPTVRRLSRQPGFAASVAGTAVLALGLASIGVLAAVRLVRSGMATPSGRPALTPDPSWWVGVVVHFGLVVGPAVIATWVMLAISGRRRPSGDWLDTLGRTLGAGWIAYFLIDCGFKLAPR